MNARTADTLYPPVASLLPHAAPMVLLDDVLEYRPEGVTCRLTLRAEAPFVDQGQVNAVVTLEYMAQAAGVFAGLEARALDNGVPWGFLIGCAELVLEVDAILVGACLVVEATRVWGDENLGQFECRISYEDGPEVARATISVAAANPSELPA